MTPFSILTFILTFNAQTSKKKRQNYFCCSLFNTTFDLFAFVSFQKNIIMLRLLLVVLLLHKLKCLSPPKREGKYFAEIVCLFYFFSLSKLHSYFHIHYLLHFLPFNYHINFFLTPHSPPLHYTLSPRYPDPILFMSQTISSPPKRSST